MMSKFLPSLQSFTLTKTNSFSSSFQTVVSFTKSCGVGLAIIGFRSTGDPTANSSTGAAIRADTFGVQSAALRQASNSGAYIRLTEDGSEVANWNITSYIELTSAIVDEIRVDKGAFPLHWKTTTAGQHTWVFEAKLPAGSGSCNLTFLGVEAFAVFI